MLHIRCSLLLSASTVKLSCVGEQMALSRGRRASLSAGRDLIFSPLQRATGRVIHKGAFPRGYVMAPAMHVSFGTTMGMKDIYHVDFWPVSI